MSAAIDYNALARGWITDVLNEDERTVLRFGMIPHQKFVLLRDALFTRLAELSLQETPYAGEVTPRPEVLKPAYRDAVERQLVHAIYANGNLVV